MISLQNITLRRGKKLLLEAVSLTIYAKQKIGLIGDNGSGKSSFFAMLSGELEPYAGSLLLPNNLEITQVKQEIPTSSKSAIEYAIDGDYRYRMVMANLSKAEEQGDFDLLAKCHDELASMEGYAITGKAEKILKGLGFKAEQLSYATTEFSGGWRMRLNLAQALMSPANLMLLDEPTNHLDLDAILWLEKWLQDFSGTLLIISHDREFLDNTIDSILHFENEALKLYKGNYSSFERQHANQLALQQATYEKQQQQIAHMQSFIERFRAKATKARQAQSRIKALQKLDLVSAVQTRAAFQFEFKKPKECPNPLIRIDKASLGYDIEQPILSQIDLQIAPSDRIGLLGVNGAGKSTFIKALAGLLQPISGSVQHYKGIKIGYFAQHQIEHLDFELSPLEALQRVAPNHREQELRNFLGSFNFSGDMAFCRVENFSGGEKARLALALIVWEAPNLLLLDEPTNHLDMGMREALVIALQDYQGALILVSHDRHLIRTTTDELMLVADSKVSRFKGDLEDYRELLFQKASIQKNILKKVTAQNVGKERRRLEGELNTLERQLAHLNQKKSELEQLLAAPALYQQYTTESIKRYQQKLDLLSLEILKTESKWLLIGEALDKFDVN